MTDNKKTFELDEDELEKVVGGRAHISGWSSYHGSCPCGLSFEVNNMRNENMTHTCSCGRTYILKNTEVYCDDVMLPISAYTFISHDE